LGKKVRIGTRGSELAIWQAEYVSALLKDKGLDTEIVTIETKGDKILHKTIAKIGSKGVFTDEIEQHLRLGNVDVAVHSAKDMPSVLPKDLEIIAYTEREKANDVIVSFNADFRLNAELTWVVGTSSTRRVAMLRHLYSKIRTSNLRGNLQTRMRKLEEGQCDALALAFAGVHRMGYNEFIVEELPLEQFTPPVGQGSVCVEVCTNLDPELRKDIREAINHPATEIRIETERDFLRKLNGGCSVPVFGYSEIKGKKIYLNGGVISLDGKQVIRRKASAPAKLHNKLGEKLGEEVLDAGGGEILSSIRKNQ